MAVDHMHSLAKPNFITILTSVCHVEVATSNAVLQRDEKLAPRL